MNNLLKQKIIFALIPCFVWVYGAGDSQKSSVQLMNDTFVSLYGSDWHFNWNTHNTPHRIIGGGIPHNFDAGDASISEEKAKQFIDDNSYLFSISSSDVDLWVNEKKGNIRYLIFNQMVDDIPVHNGRIDFRYTLDGKLVLIGHDGYPKIKINMSPSLSSEEAIATAKSDVGFNENNEDYVIGEPQKFIWVEKGETPEYHLSWVVQLFVHLEYADEYDIPVRNVKVFVDANDGEVLYYEELAASAVISGYVTGMVKDEPFGQEFNRPFANTQVQVSGAGSTMTDENGYYSIEIGSQSSDATVMLYGDWINTENTNGSEGSISTTVDPGTMVNFHFDNTNSIPGERDTYYHANLIHDFAKDVGNGFTGADYTMPANVNIGSEDPYWPCNAYWDGYTISMFSAGGGCAATDQMADVVYHEYGHGLQQFIYEPYSSPFASGMGEGCSDYWAMTITNSPCLGNGFFGNGTCLRDGNNSRQYPGSECGGQVHCLGEISMGALWKMRGHIIDSQGYDNGKSRSDSLFFFAQTARPNTVPDFLYEIIVADDDDGYLLNGTPNYADICEGFEYHNVDCPFEDIGIEHTPLSNTLDTMNDYYVETAVGSIYGDVVTVLLYYSVVGSYESVSMNFENGLYHAYIPAQSAGSVVDYYIYAVDSEGNEITSPDGAPQQTYLFLVGPMESFQIAFEDNYETDLDWQVGDTGDGANSGIWTREDPIGTYVDNVIVQPEDDHTALGFVAFITGNAEFNGDNPGDNDVDDGKTTLLSPVWDLTQLISPVISYWRWYSNDAGASPGSDYWQVDISNDGGNSWIELEYTDQTNNSWTQHQFKLNRFVDITNQMRIRFVASDEGEGSLIEAGVDDVVILGMNPFTGIHGDLNGDSIITIEDIVLVISYLIGEIEFSPIERIAADMNGDFDVSIVDVIFMVNSIIAQYSNGINSQSGFESTVPVIN